MRERDHGLLTNVVSLLVCGVLAGVVVAAAAFPGVAITGLASKTGFEEFGQLPTELEKPRPPQNTYVFASDGKTLMATFYDENRHDVTLDQVPKVMRDAIIAAEDQRFYQHNGVDLKGIIRAFVSNAGGGDTQGASTLTMQYVRQAITYSATSPAEVIAATEDTTGRKLREARLALSLENKLTKDQILQNYLNIAAFGHGAYGIYAASQVYFGKPPKDLTLGEATLLASLPKAPTTFDPVDPDGRLRALDRRNNYVLKNMVDAGSITQAQANAAKAEELHIIGTRTPNGCVNALDNTWGFFCDYVYRWWVQQPAFGASEIEREARLKSGGYNIVTTMDVDIEKAARSNIDKFVKVDDQNAEMLAAIEPGTGKVRALAVNRVFSNNTDNNGLSSDPTKKAKGIKGTYPNTTNPLLTGGGDVSGYKAGSTYKIFTMLAALEKNFPLDFTINTQNPYQSQIYPAAKDDPSRCSNAPTKWCPVNASKNEMGPKNMWTGFGQSVNTYFVPLEEKVGAENAVAMAQKLGMTFRSSTDKAQIANNGGHLWGPFTIGVADTVPLELANAYATVAAEGLYCKPIPVEAIYGPDGKLPKVTDPQCTQVVAPEITRLAADAARCPVYDRGGLPNRCNGGTARDHISGQTSSQIVGHPLIGKTGTTDYYWTANLVLSTKQLAIAGTYADPDYALHQHPNTINNNINIPVVAYTMRDAMQGKPQIDFTRPTNQKLIQGTKVAIPSVTCATVKDATNKLKAAGFEVTTATQRVDSPCTPGTVAGTDPSTSTSRGTTVVLLISNGKTTATTPPGNGGGGGPGPGR